VRQGPAEAPPHQRPDRNHEASGNGEVEDDDREHERNQRPEKPGRRRSIQDRAKGVARARSYRLVWLAADTIQNAQRVVCFREICPELCPCIGPVATVHRKNVSTVTRHSERLRARRRHPSLLRHQPPGLLYGALSRRKSAPSGLLVDAVRNSVRRLAATTSLPGIRCPYLLYVVRMSE
jgi:hypothetical protein